MDAGYRKTFINDVRKAVDSSIDHSIHSPLSGTCANLPDDGIVTISVRTSSCHGDSADPTAAAVREIGEKWNKKFEDWGLPLRLIEDQRNGSTPASVNVPVGTCILDMSAQPLISHNLGESLGLACPPPGFNPSLDRAISNENLAFAYNTFPHGEWLGARCPGNPGSPSPTDVAALAQICGDQRDYVSDISKELLNDLSTKYGNNVIGHLLGGFLADIARRLVEVSLIRGGDFRHHQWAIKLLGELVSLSVQVSVMAYFGSYTVVGGAVAAATGFCYGTFGELIIPDCIRSLLTTIGSVNLGFALIDATLGTGNWPSELIAALVGHWVAQLGLRGMEGALEHFYPEEDPAKREMLAKGNFSVWDVFETTAWTDPAAPWNLGQYMSDRVQTLRYASHVAADFIQNYVNGMVFRQNLYKQDQRFDEEYWHKAFEELDELAHVMKRVELARQPTEVTKEELSRRVTKNRVHISLNYRLTDKTPGFAWSDLISMLGTQPHAGQIATLDFRGLRFLNDLNEPESPFFQTTAWWPAAFDRVTVLAMDAMPIMFKDTTLMWSAINNLPELEALRLTVPADTNGPAAGVPPHDLRRILGYRKLTMLVADVCTDPAVAKEGGRSVHQDLIALYQSIAASSTLQTVDLRLTTDVELPPEWIQSLSKKLESNYVLCDFKPAQASGLIAKIIARNRELRDALMNVSSDPDQVNAILDRLPEDTRIQLRRLVVDVANRQRNLPSPILDEEGETELSEVIVEDGDEDSVEDSDDDKTRLPEVMVEGGDEDPVERIDVDTTRLSAVGNPGDDVVFKMPNFPDSSSSDAG